MSEKQPPIGLYIHVPFCRSKCRYCDFYSLTTHEEMDAYLQGAITAMETMAKRYPRRADTIYFGGGTPTMLGEQRLSRLLATAKALFDWQGGEITCEVNPGQGYPMGVEALAAMGVNRVSVGLQTANPTELSTLGRNHTTKDVFNLLETAHKVGIANCSVDLMWGIPGQTVASALESVDFALSLNPTHLSAYLLKVEPNTPFGRMGDTLLLPSEDTVCDIYLQCCEQLESHGFSRYEISNFAKKGFESQHNSKYWHCHETLGIGPAAHSFMEGKRFYYPRDMKAFLQGDLPLQDGVGGEFTEYAMLQLRLRKGLQRSQCFARFGHDIPQNILDKAKPLVAHGLMECDQEGLRLTLQGNLVSNTILSTIL